MSLRHTAQPFANNVVSQLHTSYHILTTGIHIGYGDIHDMSQHWLWHMLWHNARHTSFNNEPANFLHKVSWQASNRLGHVTSQKAFISKFVLLCHDVADCLDYMASVTHDRWNDTDRANQGTGRGTCHSDTLSTTNLTLTGLGSTWALWWQAWAMAQPTVVFGD
jgi:hypothetical protein